MNNSEQDLHTDNKSQGAHSECYGLSFGYAYSKFLDELIEDIILGIADGESIDLTRICQCFEMNKSKIGFVHVIDLSFLQKLAYIRNKCRQEEISTLIDSEIVHWKQLLLDSITETKQETTLYSLSKEFRLKLIEEAEKEKVTDEKNANETKKKNSRKVGKGKATISVV